MELTILKETVTLDTAPMHIAPGGSILCHITGNSRRIAKLLIELRSEIAFGMSNVTTIDADSQTIATDIFFGSADEPDFRTIFANFGEGLAFETNKLEEDHRQDALTMAARNCVIDMLK